MSVGYIALKFPWRLAFSSTPLRARVGVKPSSHMPPTYLGSPACLGFAGKPAVMPGQDYVSATNVHIHRSVAPGRSAANENQYSPTMVEFSRVEFEINPRDGKCTPFQGLYRYVPPQRVGFSAILVICIDFRHFDNKQVCVFARWS